jgi:hypothetical protein
MLSQTIRSELIRYQSVNPFSSQAGKDRRKLLLPAGNSNRCTNLTQPFEIDAQKANGPIRLSQMTAIQLNN